MELSFMEMIIISVIAFVVLGPKELARHAHNIGKIIGRVRREVDSFKTLTQEELLKEIRSEEIDRALNRAELEAQLNSRVSLPVPEPAPEPVKLPSTVAASGAAIVPAVGTATRELPGVSTAKLDRPDDGNGAT